MNKDREVILGYLKWLANRLSPSMATQLNGADVDEYLKQQVNSVDLANAGGNEVAVCMCKHTKPTVKSNGDWVCSFCGLP